MNSRSRMACARAGVRALTLASRGRRGISGSLSASRPPRLAAAGAWHAAWPTSTQAGVADPRGRCRGHRQPPACVCAIRTADCLPVLLASRGWIGRGRGTCRLARAGRRRARSHGGAHCAQRVAPGTQLVAWLGPAISAAHFEVGDEVRAAFMAHDPAAARRLHAMRAAAGSAICTCWHGSACSAAASATSAAAACAPMRTRGFSSHRRDVQHQGLQRRAAWPP